MAETMGSRIIAGDDAASSVLPVSEEEETDAIDLAYPDDQEIWRAFARIDENNDGYITRAEVANVIARSLGIAPSDEFEQVVDEQMAYLSGERSVGEPGCDTTTRRGKDTTTIITYEQFKSYYITSRKLLHRYYTVMDTNQDGQLDAEEIAQTLRALGVDASDEQVGQLIGKIDTHGDGCISFDEFCTFFLLLPDHIDPRALVGNVFDYMSPLVGSGDGPSSIFTADTRRGVLDNESLRKLMGGAVSGTIAAIVTAPLDRIRITMQSKIGTKRSLVNTFREIAREGGMRAFFKGNTANLLRIAPENGLMFLMFDRFKSRLAKDPSRATIPELFVAGALSGTLAQIATYPLSVARVHMALQAQQRGVFNCLQDIYRRFGVRALYAGQLLNIGGNLPYYALELGIFSFLRDRRPSLLSTTCQDPSSSSSSTSASSSTSSGRKPAPNTHTLLLYGCLSSATALTVTYPIWRVRTLLQAQTVDYGNSPQFSGSWHCFQCVLRQSGPKGLYTGLLPSLSRLVPHAAISYTLYTKCQELRF